MDITLYYPSKRNLEMKARELENKSTKQTFQFKYSQIISNLKNNNVKVNFEPVGGTSAKVYPDDLANARSILRSFMESSYDKTKSEWARFCALMECDERNEIALFEIVSDKQVVEMMHELAKTRCMTIQNAWNMLGYTTQLPEIRYYYYTGDLPKEWRNSSKVKSIDVAVKYVFGPNYSHRPEESVYNVGNTVFLLPTDKLIIWDIYSRYGNSVPTLKVVDDINEDELKIYSGYDFIAQFPVYAGMKTAGIIKAGATKVPISVAKRISSLMQLQQLPQLKYTLSDRSSILAYLGAYAELPPSSNKKGSRNRDVESNVNAIVENLLPSICNEINAGESRIVKFMLADSVSKLSKYSVDEIQYGLKINIDVARALLNAMPLSEDDTKHGGWVSFDNIIDWMAYNEAQRTTWVCWIQPTYFTQISSAEYLSYPDYYGRVKMPVIMGIFQMLAAIGLIDMAYESDGQFQKIRFVRITNAGLWIAKRVKTLNIEIKKIDDGLHFDPESLMITIRDTNSPNVALLEDLTEKITTNRYKITESALLRDCKTFVELKTRIDRLKGYLLGDVDSVALTQLIARLYAKINKVKPVTDAEYYFVEIDPEDKNLHQLIVSNPQIRKNTLRVEGWKLLVKKNFYSTFVEKLRQGGYLTEY